MNWTCREGKARIPFLRGKAARPGGNAVGHAPAGPDLHGRRLSHWGTIIGYDAGATSFDQLAVQWQVVTVYFAVLMTIAAVGLWFASGWGVATWLFVAVTEMVMYVGFPDLFGQDWNAVIFNAVCILAYIAFARWAGSPENVTASYRLPED